MSFARTLKEISNPVRRDILLLLNDGKMSAGDIAKHFNLTNATISYHLSQLKKAELIFEERQKNFIYYELNASVFEEVLIWFAQFQQEGVHNGNNTKQKTSTAIDSGVPVADSNVPTRL